MSAVTMLSAEIHGFVPALYYSAGNYTTLGSVRRLAVTEISGQTQRIEALVHQLEAGDMVQPRWGCTSEISAFSCRLLQQLEKAVVGHGRAATFGAWIHLQL